MEKEKYLFWGEEKEKEAKEEYIWRRIFLRRRRKRENISKRKKNCGEEEAEREKEENNWKKIFFAEEKKNGEGKGGKYIKKEKMVAGQTGGREWKAL